MIVICPQCSKRYMLDEGLLPKEGRQVRCITCHHVWRQAPDTLSALNNPPFMGIRDLAPEAAPPSEKQSSWKGWIALFALPLFLVSFFIFGRNVLVTYWPRTEKLYDLLGLHVNSPGAGLSISNAMSLIQQDGPKDMIQVAGDITNTSDRVRSIPPLKVKFIGELSHSNCLKNHKDQGCVLDYWEHRLSESSLLPGEQIHFETAPRPKIEGTQHILVEF